MIHLQHGDSLFSLLENVRNPDGKGNHIEKITVYRGRGRILTGNSKHLSQESYLLLPDSQTKRLVGDAIPRKGVVVSFYSRPKPTIPDKITAHKSAKGIKLNLPAELLAKGTVQDLPISFFEEHNL
ncbi:unnamed protein product, partial [Amoebophrya sp. A25]|eukprot:GSA25T00027847001.1